MEFKQRDKFYLLLVAPSLTLLYSTLFNCPSTLSLACEQNYQAHYLEMIETGSWFTYLAWGIIPVLCYKLLQANKKIHYLEEAEKELRFFSYYDMLSGTYNRNAFVQKSIYFEGTFHNLAVLICDIDGLKLINDTLGHNAGDELIRTTATILKQCCSSSIAIYRLGGDEFLIFLPELKSETDIKPLVDNIRQAIVLHNQTNFALPLSLSLGWALPEDTQPTLADLINLADNRMYQEKRTLKEKIRQDLLQSLRDHQ